MLKPEENHISFDDKHIDIVISILNKFQTEYKNFGLPFLSYEELFTLLTSDETVFIEKLCENNQQLISDQNTKSINKLEFVVPNNDSYSKRFVRIHKVMYVPLLNMRTSLDADIKEGITVVSGYRSPAYQTLILLKELYVRDFDMIATLKSVQKPGFSEHGLPMYHAVDIDLKNTISTRFDKTNAYKWMLERAGDFGFTQSYSKENQTGIMFEPWHWQYNK